MNFRVFVAVIVALSLAGPALFAQVSTSRLTGTVQDSSGAVVANATVTLRSEETGIARTTTSAESGTFTFDAIPTGMYTVEVEAQGFKKAVLKANEVRIGQPTTVNAVIDVGQVTETVEVVGAAEAVQTSTSGNYGNVLTEKIIKDMPIVGSRGRNPLNLVLLQPGTLDARIQAADITCMEHAIAPGTSRWTGSTTTTPAQEDRTFLRHAPILTL